MPSRDEGNHAGGGFQGNRHCGYTVVIVDAECRFDVTRLVGDAACPSDSNAKTNTKRNSAPAPPKPEKNEEESEDARLQQPQQPYPATPSDLRHIYVYRPAHSQVRAAITAAGEFMLYGRHQSRDREWWGTIVVGSSGLSTSTSTASHPSTTSRAAPADVLTGYKGWLRVDRAEPVPGFHIGISAEEALADRDRRAEAVGKSEGRWRATSRWGSYAFGC